MRRLALFPLLAAIGCGRSAPSARPAPAPAEPWSVTCTDPQTPETAFLGNGLIGLRIAQDGSGVGMPCFRVDRYETTGEERIQPQPNPAAVAWSLDAKTLHPDPTKPYRQTLDFKTGNLSTHYFCPEAEVTVEASIDPDTPLFTQEWKLKLAMDGVLMHNSPSLEEVQPEEAFKVHGQAMATPSVRVKKGQLVTLSRHVTYPIAYAKLPGRPAPDIEIEGPVEDQQAIRSFLTYLRMSVPTSLTSPGVQAVSAGVDHIAAPRPISPNALSADLYKGHTFWDADVWIFPAIALLYPERARSIPEYRIQGLGGATKNFELFWRRRMRYRVGHAERQPGAAKYPWESSMTGQETVVGPFPDEEHINGDVLWSLNMAQLLGMAKPEDVKRVEVAMAAFWKSLMTERTGPRNTAHRSFPHMPMPVPKKGTLRDDEFRGSMPIANPPAEETKPAVKPKPTGLWDLGFVFGVDEFRMTDNDLVTNILAQWTINGRTHVIPKDVPKLYIPKDKNGVFETYEGDDQLSYKQAAAVLGVFPFQYPPAEVQAQRLLDKYAKKVGDKGPAMTEAVHATIFARIGDVDRAYAEWRAAWQPFTRSLLLFSENRKLDRTYFSTGAAGCLQTVLYGFLGFRIDSEAEPGAQWSKRLNGGWLSIKPHLPKEWKRVTVRNLSVLGQNYTLEVTRQGVQMTPSR